MNLRKEIVLFFKVSFILALIVTTYFTMTSVEYSAAQKVSDKLSHALAFLVLSLLLDFSFPDSGFNWKKYLPLFLYGIMIECIQYFLPYRSFSLLDMVADALGITTYVIIFPLLIYVPELKKRWQVF
jgi:VanZ family protein